MLSTQAAPAHPRPHAFAPGILREYDIRGVVGDTLGAEDAYALGRAFATHIAAQSGNPSPEICVGYDGRLTSPMLEEALCRGLCDSGAHAVRIGLGPTPMLYFAVRSLQTQGGIMVTGSHNPPSHNGFKMMAHKQALYGQEILALGELAARGAYVSGRGAMRAHAVMEPYIATLLSGCAPQGRPLTVAWDAGNGATGDVMSAICARLPGRHITLNAAIDGTFPAHHPDPSVAGNLAQLIETVRAQRCDLGIAFDGDGDRIGVVDHTGAILWGDQLMIVLARAVLGEHPGATVIADVKASQALFDAIANAGGAPLMWKTGHSLIKAKMAETGALLAGEMSGHIFFADRYYGFDDGLYAAMRLLDILMRQPLSLAQLLEDVPHFYGTPEMRFDCEDTRKFSVIEEVRARLEAEGISFNAIDGVRVHTEDGWWLLRASNTQAVLVARCEARCEAGLARLKSMLKDQLHRSGLRLPES